jgi:hypothetical protein
MLFAALAHSQLGHAMQTSRWGFALVEMAHLLGLAFLGGSILIVDLRILGVILKNESAVAIGRSLTRVLIFSLVVMAISGIALLSEEAEKCYLSPAFRCKMALLATAIVFYFTVHRIALRRKEMGTSSLWPRAVAVISLLLWLGVGVAGRAIGLL